MGILHLPAQDITGAAPEEEDLDLPTLDKGWWNMMGNKWELGDNEHSEESDTNSDPNWEEVA